MTYFYANGVLGKVGRQTGQTEYEFRAINGDWDGFIDFYKLKMCSTKCHEWADANVIWQGEELPEGDYNSQIEWVLKETEL